MGILNLMWIAIRERTREIGALRAMGMRRGNVLRMFMFEALVLSLVAACAGALSAAVMVAIINARHFALPPVAQTFLMSDHLQLVLDVPSVLRAIFLLTAVSGLAAVYPAMRAARLRPVVAMAHIH
jgi:ABC-type lipoprotein release transport system permease subunit